MRAAGLARGGSLDNAVVVSGDRCSTRAGCATPTSSCATSCSTRMGDLYLAGGPIIGHFRGVRSGHALNRQLLEALFADPAAWCETTLAAPAGARRRRCGPSAPRLARA